MAVNQVALVQLLTLLGIPPEKQDEAIKLLTGLFDTPDDPESGTDQVSFSTAFDKASGDDKLLEMNELKSKIESGTWDSKIKDMLAPLTQIFVKKDGKMDEELFKKVAGTDGKISKEELAALDTNKDGVISEDEINVFRTGGNSTTGGTTPPTSGSGTPPPANQPADGEPTLENAYAKAAGDDKKLTKDELQFRVNNYTSGKLSAEEKAELAPLMQLFLKADGKIDEELFDKLAGKGNEITLEQILALDADKNGEITGEEIGTFKNPPATDKDKQEALNNEAVKTAMQNAAKFSDMLKDSSLPAGVANNPQVKAAQGNIDRFNELVAKLQGATTMKELNSILSQITSMAATVADAVATIKKVSEAEKSKQNTNPTKDAFSEDFWDDLATDLPSHLTSNAIRSGKEYKYSTSAYNDLLQNIVLPQATQINNTLIPALKTQFNYDSLTPEERKVVDEKIEMITKAALFNTITDMMSTTDKGDFDEVAGKGKYRYQYEAKDFTDKYLANVQKLSKQADDPKRLYKAYTDAAYNFSSNAVGKIGVNGSNISPLVSEASEGNAARVQRFDDFFKQNDGINPQRGLIDSGAASYADTLTNYEQSILQIRQGINSSNPSNKSELMTQVKDLVDKMDQARDLISSIQSADTTAEKQKLKGELDNLMQDISKLHSELSSYSNSSGHQSY